MTAMPRPSAVLRLPPRHPHRGGVVLALGLVALLLPVPLGIVLGPLARRFARQDIPKMRSGRMDPSGLGMTSAGQAAALGGMVLGGLIVGAAVLWAAVAWPALGLP